MAGVDHPAEIGVGGVEIDIELAQAGQAYIKTIDRGK